MKTDNNNPDTDRGAVKLTVLAVHFGAAFPVEFPVRQLTNIPLSALLAKPEESEPLHPR